LRVLGGSRLEFLGWTPVFVKLWMPPRQSRGNSLRISRPGSAAFDETSRPDESRVLENRSDVRPSVLPLLSRTTELLSSNPVVTEPGCLFSRVTDKILDKYHASSSGILQWPLFFLKFFQFFLPHWTR
jgi:hypothetical protein